jgi:hypothetical protein
MQIHHDMYGYWNAVWGAPATQADGPAGARWASTDGGANGAPVTQNAPEDAAHTGGGNPILQALAQALESLGLSLSTPAPNSTSADTTPSSSASTTATTSAAPAASTSATPAAATTAASSASAPALAPVPNHEISSEERTIAGDVRHLMHALFEDVRAENLLAPGSGSASASSTPGSSFASGLAALISQVQSGSAPANLQRAFDALVANLSQVGTQSASAAAPASTLNTQALLVQFLTNLQTDLGLGYGGSTGTPAQSATSGVIVNAAA